MPHFFLSFRFHFLSFPFISFQQFAFLCGERGLARIEVFPNSDRAFRLGSDWRRLAFSSGVRPRIMPHPIILHHFHRSPFSEKIRVVFGHKGLSWRSVRIPPIMPKPDLMPLTGATAGRR